MGWGNCLEGRGVGAVGRMVASRTRDLQFKSHHLKKINIWLSLAKLKTKGGGSGYHSCLSPSGPKFDSRRFPICSNWMLSIFFDSTLI